VLALVDGERVGPGEVNEENIVLAEIVLEAIERQAAVAQFLDEGMGYVGPPVVVLHGASSPLRVRLRVAQSPIAGPPMARETQSK
jgi:hypothetical protein